jgi:hypothetical protein
MLLPQTDAEIRAWNWGQSRAALVGNPWPFGGLLASGYGPDPRSPEGQARELLGVEIFNIWADRGYVAARRAAQTP